MEIVVLLIVLACLTIIFRTSGSIARAIQREQKRADEKAEREETGEGWFEYHGRKEREKVERRTKHIQRKREFKINARQKRVANGGIIGRGIFWGLTWFVVGCSLVIGTVPAYPVIGFVLYGPIALIGFMKIYKGIRM